MDKVEQIKAWANENYESSYGASCLIECFNDKELDETFPTFGHAVEYAAATDEQLSNTRYE